MKSGLLRIALEGFDQEGGWVGFDLDGTLAHYDEWKGIEHIGEPIAEMIELVKSYLDKGVEVRVFTARVDQINERESRRAVEYIQQWCEQHIGTVLMVTNIKDSKMIRIYDDRAVSVEKNEGATEDANAD